MYLHVGNKGAKVNKQLKSTRTQNKLGDASTPKRRRGCFPRPRRNNSFNYLTL